MRSWLEPRTFHRRDQRPGRQWAWCHKMYVKATVRFESQCNGWVVGVAGRSVLRSAATRPGMGLFDSSEKLAL